MGNCPFSRWAVFSFWMSTFLIPGRLMGAGFADIPTMESILGQSGANAFIKTVGLNMDNRSFEPASPLGSSLGFEMGISVLLTQPPSDLGTALGNLSSGGTSSGSGSATIPTIPSLKFDLHKGLGSRVDLGASLFPPVPTLPYIGKSFMLGGDLKIILYEAEEGLTWALRNSYNYNNLVLDYSGQTITVTTHTFSPQLLVSRKMDFADPYIGVAGQYAIGKVRASIPVPDTITVPLPLILPEEITSEMSGSGYNLYVFGGVAFVIPAVGMKIVIEGSYSPYGMNSLGTKIGVTF